MPITLVISENGALGRQVKAGLKSGWTSVDQDAYVATCRERAEIGLAWGCGGNVVWYDGEPDEIHAAGHARLLFESAILLERFADRPWPRVAYYSSPESQRALKASGRYR